VKLNADILPVEKMCKVFKISKSRYYAWCRHPESARAAENQRLTALIRKEFADSHLTYGSPRVAGNLRKAGVAVSRPRVARLMRKACLRSVVARKFVSTTDSRHGLEVAPNLLDRNFKPGKTGVAWVSDITYIRTGQGWLYLTVIIDLGDRKVIGWALSRSMHAEVTVVAAWRMAMVNRAACKGLIFHSDRGVQYACKEFRELLKARNVRQSMSGKGDCWDNAVAESFFKSLKSEWLDHKDFKTREQAAAEVFIYIEAWYNRKRLHSTLGYRSPEQYAKDMSRNTIAA
jgi:transposase InsO family protein